MSDPVASISLTVFQGEDYVARGTHRVSAKGSPVDITDWTIAAYLEKPDGTIATIAGAVVSGLGSAGVYELAMSSATSATLAVADYPVNVWRTNTGAATVMARGTVAIRASIRSGG